MLADDDVERVPAGSGHGHGMPVYCQWLLCNPGLYKSRTWVWPLMAFDGSGLLKSRINGCGL